MYYALCIVYIREIIVQAKVQASISIPRPGQVYPSVAKPHIASAYTHFCSED